jgi:sugar phosphate isomerase/epimerase
MVLMRVGGHSNTYHTRTAEEAWAGIAAAGYRTVELSSVIGWTEHVDLDADPAGLYARLAHYGLEPTVLSAHSDLTTDDGVEYALKAIGWAANNGIAVMNTAIGGHSSQEENESAFLAGIGRVAEAADAAGVDVALEIHGDIMATGARTVPLLQRIDHPRIKVAYDTANCEFYGDTKAVDDLHTMLPYLANVHLKDKRGGKGVWDFPEPGAGHVDFAGILGVLRDGGYDGPASVEIEFDGSWPDLADIDAVMKAGRDHLVASGYDCG